MALMPASKRSVETYPQGGNRGFPYKQLGIAQAGPDGVNEGAHMHVEHCRCILGQLAQNERSGVPPSLPTVAKPLDRPPHLESLHVLLFRVLALHNNAKGSLPVLNRVCKHQKPFQNPKTRDLPRIQRCQR